MVYKFLIVLIGHILHYAKLKYKKQKIILENKYFKTRLE